METITDTPKKYGYAVEPPAANEKKQETAHLVRMIEELREKLAETLAAKQKLQQRNEKLKIIISYAWEDGLNSGMALYTKRRPAEKTNGEILQAFKSSFINTIKQFL